MEKYCNNCGNFGHYYRDCRYPILSYGIILYDDSIKNNIKIVLIERKNSLSFIEFMRGKYDINSKEYIQILFNRMSNNEKQLLVENDFDTLWKNLWVDFENVNSRIKREYTNSKKNFEILKSSFNSIINNCDCNYLENEWEIPKGRRNNREQNKLTAIREFNEETNISQDNYKIIQNIVPLNEEYQGINKVNYKHVYYIAKLTKSTELYIDKKNKNQVLEVNNIMWVNRKECLEKIRGYSISKIKVINQFFDFIENIDSDNIKNI